MTRLIPRYGVAMPAGPARCAGRLVLAIALSCNAIADMPVPGSPPAGVPNPEYLWELSAALNSLQQIDHTTQVGPSTAAGILQVGGSSAIEWSEEQSGDSLGNMAAQYPRETRYRF